MRMIWRIRMQLGDAACRTMAPQNAPARNGLLRSRARTAITFKAHARSTPRIAMRGHRTREWDPHRRRMGYPTITAGRIYRGSPKGSDGESYKWMEKLPFPRSRELTARRKVADSATTAVG